MNFSSSTQLEKTAILSGVMLVLFIIFYFALWTPGLRELKRYQSELNKKSAELVQLERDAKDWPNTITREMINKYENKLELLWDLIPTEEGLSLLIDEVRNHAFVSGLEIISLKRESAAKQTADTTQPGNTNESKYEKASYKIKLRGSYFGLVQFIQRLEESDRLITINGIESRANTGNDPLQWGYAMEADVDFNIYYSGAGVEKV